MPAHTPKHENHSAGLPHSTRSNENTTPIPSPFIRTLPSTIIPPTPNPTTKPKNKSVVQKVLSSFTKKHTKRQRIQRIQRDDIPAKNRQKTGTATVAAASARYDYLANHHRISHLSYGPRARARSGRSAATATRTQQQLTNDDAYDKRKLVEQRRRRNTYAKTNMNMNIIMHGERQEQRTGAGASSSTSISRNKDGHHHHHHAHKMHTHIKNKPHPHPHHLHLHNSPTAPHPPPPPHHHQKPLVLRTRNASNASNSVNYCYPVCSPKSNRVENPFASLPIIQRRTSNDSNTYASSDASSNNNTNNNNNNNSNDMMTINIYRSASLAQGQGQGRASGSAENKSVVGRGISVRETLDRDKPTPSTPQDSRARADRHAENNSNNNGEWGLQPKSRRKMSIKENKSQNHHKHVTPAWRSKAKHRRRQTRYGRPSLRGAGVGGSGARAPSPTSTYYDSLDIYGPLSTPSLYGKLASQGQGGDVVVGVGRGGGGSSSPPITPPLLSNDDDNSMNASLATIGGGCPMKNCGKPVLPSGLCRSCDEAFQMRMSMFGPLTGSSRAPSMMAMPPLPVTDPVEFNKMFGPMESLDVVNDSPADKVASKFNSNPKFSPRLLNTGFKLQPPPGRKVTAAPAASAAAKHDSMRSTGSDRSHVGFQMAVPRTPEPKQQQQQQQELLLQRRYSSGGGYHDEDADADPGSATSVGSWESSYSYETHDSPPPSARLWDPADSPSFGRGRNNKQQSWESAESKGYSDIVDIVDIFRESRHDNDDDDDDHDDVHGNDDIYTEINNIIDEYLKDNELDEMGNERRKESVIASFSETVDEIDDAKKALVEEDSTPPQHGFPKRGKVVKKPRNTSGLKETTNVNVRSSNNHSRNGASEPEKHPQWDWI